MTWDRTTTDLWSRDPRTPLGRHKLGPQNHNHRTTAVIHLRPTSDWPVILCDQLATDLWLRRDRFELPVGLGKSLHDIKISRVTCDRFTIVLNAIPGHRVINQQPGKTCDQRRIQLRVGSLASEVNKFHDRFWWLKVVVERVDFNGE